MEGFLVEMDDIDLSCGAALPLIQITEPTTVSELLDLWPAMEPEDGWSLANRRLRSSTDSRLPRAF